LRRPSPAVALAVPALLLLGSCRTGRPSDPLTRGAAQEVRGSGLPGSAARGAEAGEALDAHADARRAELLAEAGGGHDLLAEALRSDDFGGPVTTGEAIEAYAEGRELKAVLLAQAALGADPGNGARRRLLSALEKKTGLKADAEGILPMDGLVHLELKRAEEAFFSERFGAAVQACRRVLLLDPDSRDAWLRLGSAHYALGDEDRAKAAYLRARQLEPGDAGLDRFLETRGWLPKVR
jgi:tetratricopeptide (TPR) repeat protein